MDYEQMSDALAFCGNSLLAPMTQTASVGLDPAFWEAFPGFGSEQVAQASQTCAAWAREFCANCDAAGQDAVTRCAVEYTRLFVGPPRPAAAPWETAYRAAAAGAEAVVGFGQATFEMRELLREAGLQLSNENHQYEDHMGIELLLLSELCRRAAAGGQDAGNASAVAKAAAFAAEHPAAWVGDFRAKAASAAPSGYFVNLLGVISALLGVVVGHNGA